MNLDKTNQGTVMPDNLKIFSLMGKMPIKVFLKVSFSSSHNHETPSHLALAETGPQRVSDDHSRLTISATGAI
jgi:hypothetical protein